MVLIAAMLIWITAFVVCYAANIDKRQKHIL